MQLGRVSLAALIGPLMVASAYPLWQRSREIRALRARVERAAPVPADACAALLGRAPGVGAPLASWQSVGGCGASAGTGVGGGVKWIGRNVSGGLMGVQCQSSYLRVESDPLNPQKIEHQLSVTTLVTKELTSNWNAGVTIPYAYKYLRDPYGLTTKDGAVIDLSNGGLGDVSLQTTLKLGPINATALTATVSLPTGAYDTQYRRAYLRQHQQLGFGKVAGALTLDHTMDELWGLAVIGGSAAWRGGENRLSNYRAPSGSVYAYTGYFLGPLVPSAGLILTGYTAHDRDRGQDENTPLGSATLQLSLEWSTSWVALIAGALVPYQYDGVDNVDGRPRSPWGWGPWSVSLGLSFAPF